jgi:hypothetical protein
MAQSAPSSDPALAAAAVNTPQIILIDASNKIEVLGVSGTTIANPALWVSPTGYWSNLATGDFNHDGDQ